jgi:OOP family OmpA-OmpF porin
VPKLKLFPKLLLFAALVGGLTYGYRHAVYTGLIPRPNMLKSVIPVKTEEISAEVITNVGNVKQTSLPSSAPVSIPGPKLNFEIWAWNTHMGFLFATGGPQTAKGSLMEKYGVPVTIKRQDDTGQMQTDILACADNLKKGSQQDGCFVTIMGDGAAQFFQAINPKLTKLGPDYTAEIVGSLGYSRGEDKFMGLPAWKTDPQSAKGALIVGVLRDGDWNIAMKWAAMNGIPNNPDERVYDPNALNWVNADSYTKAAEMYVQNYCDERPVKGKPGERQKVCANGIVTWTPGDVTAAKKRGGLVSVLSTKESAFQMPNVIIGIRKWDRDHRDLITKMLAASFEGADQVKVYPAALQKAAQISKQVYAEESAEYWLKYYKGVTETDAQGLKIFLGGSTVSNLADNLQLFGMREGTGNIMKATYETFGNLVVQQYPNLVPTYPKYADVVDASYVMGVQAIGDLPTNNATDTTDYSTNPIKEVAGKRDYQIQFASGSANILPVSFPVLNQIVDDVLMTKFKLLINGFTDNAQFKGLTPEQSADRNMELSRLRAEAVKAYFQRKASKNFPDHRVNVVPHGQEDPVAENTTEAGRAQNRRVQIVMGTVE